MNTRELEKIAKAARVLLMTQCEARLNFVLSHEKDPIFAADGAAIRQLKAQKHDTLIEKAAYTWFNRFMAFRFMDVHGFNRPLIVSPAVDTDTRPQLLSRRAGRDHPFGSSVRSEKTCHGSAPRTDPQL